MLLSNAKKIFAFCVIFMVASCAPSEKPFKGQKVGKPYEINGKIYRPEPDSSYDKIGDASWYGPGFDGNRTASGEIFDQDDITAAHPTLPMPSLVKVTNLKNNESIVVRINDRGPFHANRIIDLSKKSAEMIDMKSTMPVRVQYLADETEQYLASIQGTSPKIDMFAYNNAYKEKTANRKQEMAEAINYSEENFNNSEVENFAAVGSVSSNDLPQPEQTNKISRFVISDAVASENIVYPDVPTDNEEVKNVLEKPVAKPVASKEQKIQPQNTSNEKFIIIAGSFSAHENAKKLSDGIANVTGNPKLVMLNKISLSGKEWWTVHAGPFASREVASRTLASVQALGVPDARVVKQQ